jgi:hypothetical protein
MKVIAYKVKRYVWLNKQTGVIIDYGPDRQGYQFKKDAESAMRSFETITKTKHFKVVDYEVIRLAICDNRGRIIIKGFSEDKLEQLEQMIRTKKLKNAKQVRNEIRR